MGVNIPREQLGGHKGGCQWDEVPQSRSQPRPGGPGSQRSPRCSVCLSAWKSTSCPFWSWPTAVLANITVTNLLNEPEGREVWLITWPSGSLLGSASHFLSVCRHSPSSSPCHLAACLDMSLPASPLSPPTQSPYGSQRALLRCESSNISRCKPSNGFHSLRTQSKAQHDHLSLLTSSPGAPISLPCRLFFISSGWTALLPSSSQGVPLPIQVTSSVRPSQTVRCKTSEPGVPSPLQSSASQWFSNSSVHQTHMTGGSLKHTGLGLTPRACES